MNKKILSILIISIFFIGCSQKHNKHVKPTDLLHEQALISTQKIIIKDNDSVKAYLTVTHLNEIKQDRVELDEETEIFLVGVYIPTDDKKKDFFDISHVEVNGVFAGCITPLENSNPMLDIISFKNPWSIYFLVEAPIDITKQGVVLEVFLEDIGSAKLSFYDGYGNLPMGPSIGFKTTQTSD